MLIIGFSDACWLFRDDPMGEPVSLCDEGELEEFWFAEEIPPKE